MIKIIVFAALASVYLGACQINMPSDESKSDIGLAGSEWGLANTSKVFIAFKADGRAIGSGGCNNFFADFSLNPSSDKGSSLLGFGPIGATKKMCPPAIMKGENALFTALKQTQSAEFSHLTLKLMDKDGTPLLTLQRRDWD